MPKGRGGRVNKTKKISGKSMKSIKKILPAKKLNEAVIKAKSMKQMESLSKNDEMSIVEQTETGVIKASGFSDTVYPCGKCGNPVRDNDKAIQCDSGCDSWYHCVCTGMLDNAYELLTMADSAEWACDFCVSRKNIPCVRTVSENEEIDKHL